MQESKLLVANWKMNPLSVKDAEEIFEHVANGMEGLASPRIVICPPFPFLASLSRAKERHPLIDLGAQDSFWEDQGPYTGEVSPAMLASLNCSHVILGHSERRRHLGETSAMVRKKIISALKARLTPVVCAENPSQLEETMGGMSKEETDRCIVVFEPSWAISTNEGAREASVEEIKRAAESFRKIVANAPMLYGGSIAAENIAEIVMGAGLRGALVGKASLNAEEFVSMARAIA